MDLLQETGVQTSLIGVDEGLVVESSPSGDCIEVCGVLLRGHGCLSEVVELSSRGECSVWFSESIFECTQELGEGCVGVVDRWVEHDSGKVFRPCSGSSSAHP